MNTFIEMAFLQKLGFKSYIFVFILFATFDCKAICPIQDEVYEIVLKNESGFKLKADATNNEKKAWRILKKNFVIKEVLCQITQENILAIVSRESSYL